MCSLSFLLSDWNLSVESGFPRQQHSRHLIVYVLYVEGIAPEVHLDGLMLIAVIEHFDQRLLAFSSVAVEVFGCPVSGGDSVWI